MITTQENKLIYTFNQETVLIEPWGKNAIRVRAIKQAAFPEENWALTQPCTHSCTIAQSECYAQLENGKITARISSGGKLTVYNSTGKNCSRNTREIGEIFLTRSAVPLKSRRENSARFPAAITI